MLIDFRTKDGKQGLFERWNIKPKGVLHVGGNRGEEAPVYLELGVANQVWIEANPYICEQLQNQLRSNPEASFHNFAATDENGTVILHESNNGSQSSSLLELGTHLIAHPEVHYVRDIPVAGYRIEDTPYVNAGLDFLNMDIQGNELKALRGMGELLNQFKWAYLEVNKEELYKGCALVEDIDFYLAAYGFQRVETKWCGNTGWGDALYVKS